MQITSGKSLALLCTLGSFVGITQRVAAVPVLLEDLRIITTSAMVQLVEPPAVITREDADSETPPARNAPLMGSVASTASIEGRTDGGVTYVASARQDSIVSPMSFFAYGEATTEGNANAAGYSSEQARGSATAQSTLFIEFEVDAPYAFEFEGFVNTDLGGQASVDLFREGTPIVSITGSFLQETGILLPGRYSLEAAAVAADAILNGEYSLEQSLFSFSLILQERPVPDDGPTLALVGTCIGAVAWIFSRRTRSRPTA